MSRNLADRLKAQITRKRLTGYLLLFAITMVFVFFGYTGKYSSVGVGSVASVNSATISVTDFQNEEAQIEQYYSQIFGGQFDMGPQRGMLRRQAIEKLIQRELVAQGAVKQGVIATDQEVRDFITQDIPAFQDKGNFDRERYKRYLEYMKTNPADFENQLRKEIVTQRLQRVFEWALNPADLETKKQKELKNTLLNVRYAEIDTKNAKVSVSAGEIAEKLKDPAVEQKLKARFEASKKDFSQSEEVKAQHILLKTVPGKEAEVLKKITELRDRSGKEDFGSLAQKFSEDPGSKSKKGDLGYFSKGKMAKEFEEAAFKLKVGEVSQPVKTTYGYHLIKVSDHKAAQEAKFEDFKEKLAKEELAQAKVNDALLKLEAALAKNDAKSVDEILKSLDVSWKETGDFDLAGAGPKAPSSKLVKDSVYDLSPAKPLYPRVLRDGNMAYVLEWKDLKKASAKSEAPEANADLSRRRSSSFFNSWIEQQRQMSKIEINPQVLAQ